MTLVPDSFTSTPATRFKMEGLLGTLRRVMQVPLTSASCSPRSCAAHRANLHTHQDFPVDSARLEQRDLSGRGEQAGWTCQSGRLGRLQHYLRDFLAGQC